MNKQYWFWIVVITVVIALIYFTRTMVYEGFTQYTMKNGPNNTTWAWPQSKYGTYIPYNGYGNYLFGW